MSFAAVCLVSLCGLAEFSRRKTPADALISPDAPVKSLGVVTIDSGQPTSLPTQVPTTMEGITREQIGQTITADLRLRWQVNKVVTAALGIENLNNYK